MTMPPSPVMRCSPGREPRADKHKRGRSLEGPIPFREKDDDLALFNEVQSQEKDNFLLQSNDDFEDLFSSKLRYFSDHKHGISTTSRGESSDLLNAEGEKNDYDWLLTPPDTPLFTSLDDEAPPVNLPLRGRPRSQPISISRSSTMERSHRSSRGSASPNRLSPSPRSSRSTSQSRGRPSSLPHTSPPPSLHNATPTRRSSPPSSKSPTPAPRSSTPSPGRTSVGSSGPTVPSWARGNSPAKPGRRNSTSPKIKAWQTNISGFSSEAPPNLRTSLGDRPASYVRGSSPASRNGSNAGRQSMSPTASRSISSSHSYERDKLSSHGKASVASSGDDEVESLLSVPVSSSSHSAPRSLNSSSNNRSLNSLKKPTRIVTPSSAPKRSFDMAGRQTDHRKGPHNMFRPLLSSVPSSTIYASKSGAMHRTIASRNSSVTTSSNASSDLGFSVGHGTENSEPNEDDLTSEHMKVAYLKMEEGVFFLDQAESIIDDDQFHKEMPHNPHDGINNITQLDTQLLGGEAFQKHDMNMDISAASEVLNEEGDISMHYVEDIVLCSRCGSMFQATEEFQEEPKLCMDCKGLGVFPVTITPEKGMLDMDSPSLHEKDLDRRVTGTPESTDSPESTERTIIRECGTSYSKEQISYSAPHENLIPERDVGQHSGKEDDQMPTRQNLGDQHTVNSCTVDGENCSRKLLKLNSCLSSKADVSEGVGIPLLLRSSSGKGPIVRSRNFAATSMTLDDFSYMRESVTSTRSSFGHGSASASSSIDFGSSKQSESRVLQHLSGRKSDNELRMKHQRSVSSLSETSTHAFPVSGLERSCQEENFELSAGKIEKDIAHSTGLELQELALPSEGQEDDGFSIEVESNGNWRTVSDLSSSSMSIHIRDASMASISNLEDSDTHDNGKSLMNSCINATDQDASSTYPENCPNRVDILAPNQTSLVVISEIETDEDDVVSPDAVLDVGSQNSQSSLDDLEEASTAKASCTDIVSKVEDSIHQNSAESTQGESTVMLEGKAGNHARSFTLEEATDAILFCRSIVHNLAYEAANLAVEKESPAPLEVLQPISVGKSNFDRRDPRSRNVAKRNSKSQKPRQRKVETDSKPPPVNTADNDISDVSQTRIVGTNKGDATKPPKLESKCNCVIM